MPLLVRSFLVHYYYCVELLLCGESSYLLCVSLLVI